jgi:hypothetical protein
MPYNTDLTRLKDLLENPTGLDEELSRDLEAAYGEVRDTLKQGGFSVPLSDANESIREVEALLAAAKFRLRRHNDKAFQSAQGFQNEAVRILKIYMSSSSQSPVYFGKST